MLDGIPPARRGTPQIEVTFDIDANGILHVSAKDKGTGREQSIRIEASTGLSDDEINRMRDEAKANEETDKVAREKVEKLNRADGLVFETEKQMTEYGDKLSDAVKKPIEDALTELKEAHKNQDIPAIDAAMEKLNQAWQNASQEIYAAQQADGNESANTEAPPTEENNAGTTDDVEFEEVETK
jgi:molecular chaperone DnaK